MCVCLSVCLSAYLCLCLCLRVCVHMCSCLFGMCPALSVCTAWRQSSGRSTASPSRLILLFAEHTTATSICFEETRCSTWARCLGTLGPFMLSASRLVDSTFSLRPLMQQSSCGTCETSCSFKHYSGTMEVSMRSSFTKTSSSRGLPTKH